MKRLLAASVFAPSHRTAAMLGLQQEFLSKTTQAPYDHAVWLTDGVDRDLFGQQIVIGQGHVHHQDALAEVHRFFLANPYDYYLLLDSDAFPCRPDWLRTVVRQLDRHGLDVAAAVRCENFDTFPHPSVFFVRGRALETCGVTFAHAPGTDLLGRPFMDTGAGMAGLPVYPLLRSNAHNPHPMLAGVYNHLFYHHGAGSRFFVSRTTLAGYYDHYLPAHRHAELCESLFESLVLNPEAFLARLMGDADAPPG